MSRITDEKNLAFADQPAPLSAREVAERIKSRPATEVLDPVEIELRSFLATEGAPLIEAHIDQELNPVLRVGNFRVGEHVFPPNIPAIGLDSLGNRSESFDRPLVAEGYAPAHLALQTSPKPVPPELITPVFYRDYVSPMDRKQGNQATTIFLPENRRIFLDTSYPWGTCGRVDTPIGQGSGAMVGPRHLLTCSHVIQWNSDGTAGWVQFRPAYFAPSAPFGDAWASHVYFKYKVVGPTVDTTEGMYDYVVCVLDRRIGDLTGWLGGKGYTDSWDGGSYWAHVGYPGDMTGGNKPTYENGIALDGVWWQADSHESMAHRGDVWPGQSGGPFFGWWSDGAYAVAVQSSHNSSENNASGGQDLVDLILRARSEYP